MCPCPFDDRIQGREGWWAWRFEVVCERRWARRRKATVGNASEPLVLYYTDPYSAIARQAQLPLMGI
jgi:hypothetical protein